MKSSAVRSHLSCIHNNLGWARDAERQRTLESENCPGRELIRQQVGGHQIIGALLCACEQACCRMRDAYNRRDLNQFVDASRERTICREKLVAALNGHALGAPAH